MSQSPNRILNALPQKVFAAIKLHLKPVKLSFAEVVAETDQSITQVYFPFSGDGRTRRGGQRHVRA